MFKTTEQQINFLGFNAFLNASELYILQGMEILDYLMIKDIFNLLKKKNSAIKALTDAAEKEDYNELINAAQYFRGRRFTHELRELRSKFLKYGTPDVILRIKKQQSLLQGSWRSNEKEEYFLNPEEVFGDFRYTSSDVFDVVGDRALVVKAFNGTVKG